MVRFTLSGLVAQWQSASFTSKKSEVRILSGPLTLLKFMNVVFFSPYFYPHIGGVEKHVLEVAKSLKKRGHRIIVITEGDKDKKENIFGIEVYRLNFGRKDWFRKFRIWLKIIQYRNIVKRSDIVHCHDVFFWYFPLRFFYPKKRVFITFHGFENIPPSTKEVLIRKLSEKLSRGNIAVGDYIKKWYGTKPNFVIYGGINKIHENKKSLNRLKPKILLIGRLDKDIGINSYIQTLENLKNFKLVVCGDGEFKDELKKLGEVKGFVSSVDEYIKKADVVFASSYLSIMQALSFRKPVFSVYENNLKKDYLLMSPLARYIVVDRSPQSLASKVKLIIRNNSKRTELLRKSSDWIINQTWDKVADKYLLLWK